MKRPLLAPLVGLSALLVGLAGPAIAQQRVALVIAGTTTGDGALPSARDDALSVSEALFGLGFQVTRLENPSADKLRAATAELGKDTSPAVVYFVGHAFARSGINYVQTGTLPADQSHAVPLSVMIADLQRGGRTQTLLVLDTCHGAASQTLPDQGALAPIQNLPDLFVVLPQAPGKPCPADRAEGLAQTFLDRISVAGAELSDNFPVSVETPAAPVAAEPRPEDPASEAPVLTPAEAPVGEDSAADEIWVRSTLATPFVFRAAQNGMQLTAEDYRMLDNLTPEARDKMLAFWAENGIAVAGETSVFSESPPQQTLVVSPISPVIEAISALSPVTAANATTITGSVLTPEEVVVLNATTSAPRTLRSVPGTGGLPQPSIILGEIAPTLAGFEVPAAETLDYTDLAARRALRGSDPAAFENAVSNGAYDPPQPELARAMQTELSRMNCYTGGIDGQWGNGSRTAVQRYYQTLNVAAPSLDPAQDVFRQFILKDDVSCPAPVQASAPRATNNAATPQRQPRTTTAAPKPAAAKPAAAAPPKAAATPPKRTIGKTLGTGTFR